MLAIHRIWFSIVVLVHCIFLDFCASEDDILITPRAECDSSALCNAIVYSDNRHSSKHHYFFAAWRLNVTTASVNCSLPLPAKKDLTKSLDQDQKHICLIDKRGWEEGPLIRFQHFPHAGEALFPCWNYFVECYDFEMSSRNLLVITNFSQSAASLFYNDRWTKTFLEVAGMSAVDATKYLLSQEKSRVGTTLSELHEELDRNSFVKPSRYLQPDSVNDVVNNWHIGPKAARTFSALNSIRFGHPDPFIEKDQTVLTIGILNRKGSREIDNGAALKTALIERKSMIESIISNQSLSQPSWQRYQSVLIGHTTMDTKDFSEQVAWAGYQDIVITPHGAQNTNLAFIRPCTTVLEIYPHTYFIPNYFMTLVAFAGGIGYSMVEIPHVNASVYAATRASPSKVQGRSVHLEVDVDIIVDHVIPTMLQAHLACLASAQSSD